MGFRRHIQESPKIDLTPMVDIVFLLVIFFMISTTFVEQPGVKVDLPEAGAQFLNRQGKEIKAYLAANGDIYLERQQVSLAQAREKLTAYSPEQTREMTFIVMADKAVRHGAVIALMDMAQQAGFGHLAMATEANEAAKQ